MKTNQVISQDPGLIILLDDEATIRDSFRQLFEDYEIGLEFIACANYSEYNNLMKRHEKKVKCIIMDLSNEAREFDLKIFDNAYQLIEKEYRENRIPIFIHSGNLDYFDQFPDQGTVFRVRKSGSSAKEICDIIKSMHESSFLDFFCQDGYLERKLMSEIHSAFTTQFKANEIEKIITSIRTANPDNVKNRVVEVFQRIVIRAFYQNLISSQNTDIKLNTIEHFYRRTSKYPVWTGDIFKNNQNNEYYIVLTPRCDLENSKANSLLLAKVELIDENNRPNSKNFVDIMQDNVRGLSKRFIPAVPQFSGGFVKFNEIQTISQKEFIESYERVISLSDEYTNEVVRKFSSYISRGGISVTEYEETKHYLNDTIR